MREGGPGADDVAEPLASPGLFCHSQSLDSVPRVRSFLKEASALLWKYSFVGLYEEQQGFPLL